MIKRALIVVGILSLFISSAVCGGTTYGDFKVVGTGADAGISFEFLASGTLLTPGLITTFDLVACTVPVNEDCSFGAAQVGYAVSSGVIRLTTSGSSGTTRTWFFPSMLHKGVYLSAGGAGVEPGYVIHSGAEATAGNPQSNATGSAFQFPLEVTVNDSSPNYQSGVTVTFTAPGSGPSASLPSGGQAITDATGRASITPTANGTAGAYQVTATAEIGADTYETSFVVANVNTANASGACQVTTPDDDFSAGSLRYQIAACGKGGTITFAPNITSVNLSNAQDIPLTQDLTIDGGSGVTINANGQSRIFFITGGTVTLKNLTLENGAAAGGAGGAGTVGGGGGAAGMGGAIFVNAGSLVIDQVTFGQNQAIGGGGGSVLPGLFSAGGGGMGGPGGSSSAGINGNGGGGGDFGSHGGGGTGGVQNGAGDGAGGGNTGSGAFGGGGSGSVISGAGGFGGGAGGALSAPGSSGTFAGSGGPIPPNGGGSGGAGLGGAIFMRNGTLSLTSAVFTGNSATGGTSQSGGSNGEGKGGALYISSTASAVSATGLPTFGANSAGDAGTGTACNTVTGTTAFDTNDICGILAGPVTHFSVTTVSPETANVAFAVQVRALDDNDNVVTAYSGTVHLTSTDPEFANGTGDSTLTNGELQFGVGMKTAGTQTITATDTVTSSVTGTSSGILVNPAAPAFMAVSGPSTIVGGTSFPFTVTITDSYGNLSTNYSGTLHFTSSDTAAVLPADFALTGATQSFNATLKSPGNQTITVTDTALAGSLGAIAVTIPDITVTTTADTGVGSLRIALAVAAADGSGNITFDSGGVFATAQTITAASTLDIPSYTSITGPAAGVTISGGGSTSNFSVFNVASGVTSAAITGLTIANGYTDSQGGGILNAGALTVTRSSFLNNYAGGYITPAGNGGGAIYAASGALTIIDSTFSGNTSAPGGAITANSGAITISGSTFSGNAALAGKAGGAIFVNNAAVTIANSTFTGNSAAGGGAVFNYGTMTVANSILSGNSGGDCDASGGATCATNGTDGNVVGVNDVSLAPLGNYGGPTQTLVPLPGSPAICGGINSSLPAADQRGLPRTTTYGATTCVDSGAVQTNYSLAFTAEPPATTTVGVPFAAGVTLSESGTAFQPAVSIPLSLTGGSSFSPVTTSSGIAAFPSLTVNLAGGPNTLTSALSLTPSISVSAVSNPFTSILATTVTSLHVSTTTTTATLLATVTAAAGTPTGTVQFMQGPTILGTTPLVGGTASWTGSPSAGLVTAVYSGSAIFAASSSTPQNIVYTSPTSPGQMTITSSANPSVFGQPVTFTVSFATPIPTTGSVQFSSGATFLGAIGMSGSRETAFTTSALPLGSNTVAVVYNGDSNYSSTQGRIVQVVNQAATVTTQSLSPAGSGQATLTAAVNAATPATGTPSGTIQFQDLSNNNAVLATATLSNGSASANLSTDLATHPVVAVYSGDEDFITSKSAPLPTVVSAVGVLTATYAPDQIVSLYAVPGLAGDKAGTPPYPDTLSGVTVTITDSAGTPRKALLYGVFASAGQINLVIPSDTALGTAQVTTKLADGTVVTSLVNISSVSPGIFTANEHGQGVFVGSIVNVGPANQQTISESTVFDSSQSLWVAQPVSVSPDPAYLVLYGTGIRHAASVTATIGGVNVPVAYSGVQPTYPGMDQINLGPLPQSLAGAGPADIVINADGKTTNTVTTAIQ